jgi:hypothetical protein
MTLASRPLRLFRLPRARRPFARLRLLAAGLAAVLLSQLAGCAAQLWPPSNGSLSVDLPFLNQQPVTDTAANPSATPVSVRLTDPGNTAEARDAEIERLKTIEAQYGQIAAMRAVEDSLPLATPVPTVPPPPRADPDKTGSSP